MMKTSLLITERFEPTADLLVAELRRREVPCVRWNLDQFPCGSALTYRACGDQFDAKIVTDGRTVHLDDVGSIWCRGFTPAGLPDNMEDKERRFAETEAGRALAALLTIGSVLWINNPERMRRANSKPAQLYAAQRIGFDIPATVITNDPDEVRAFAANSREKIIYKTLSQSLDLDPGEALFTALVTEKEIANLELIRSSPGIFQERVAKAYEVRSTVVGKRIFSARIESQAHAETRLDWRQLPFEVDDRPIDLPHDVEEKIHAFMAAFGLVYGAFDFIATPEGRHVFLEVNPSGQYMWVESKTGLKITAALVEALVEPCRT